MKEHFEYRAVCERGCPTTVWTADRQFAENEAEMLAELYQCKAEVWKRGVVLFLEVEAPHVENRSLTYGQGLLT